MRIANCAGLLRLTGFLVLTSAIAAARPAPSAVLTITPAAHNYGQVIVHATGASNQFKVTLPPGGSPSDSVLISFTGPNATDFRVNASNVGRVVSTSTCTDSTGTWRSGSCDVWVEFVPQATGVRNATLVVSDTRGNRGTASLTGTGLFGCLPVLVACNYASNYSGSFSWSSSLVTKSGSSSGPEYRALALVSVKVNVIKGVAYCTGTQSDSSESRTAGRLDEMRKTNGAISGPGLFVVEFRKQSGQLVSVVTAWCPTSSGNAQATDYNANQTTTGTFSGKPAKQGGSGGMTMFAPVSAIGIDLISNQTMPHPDSDALNGVTGTLNIAWSLIIS